MCALSTINAKVSSYSTAKYDDWGAVKTLLTAGPCVIGIHASPKFYNYESGLFDDPVDYDGTNHMVVAVGYGKISGVEYIKSKFLPETILFITQKLILSLDFSSS